MVNVVIRIAHPAYLIVFVFFHSAETKHGMSCDKMDTLSDKLEWAEMIIKSAKEEIPYNSLPMDCEEVLNSGDTSSGVYRVWPKNRLIEGPITVYCDMDTDGGGWTVIQRRGNFSRDKEFFFQDWKAYKEGFGNLKEEFWLGNDKIYALSNQKKYSMRFDLTAFDGSQAYALYDSFSISDDNSHYKLHVVGYSGNAGDSFSYHSGCRFSTKDRDNDNKNTNCAEERKGAWWFKDCYRSHLNGILHGRKPPVMYEGVIWSNWKGENESLTATEMKIRKFPSWDSK